MEALIAGHTLTVETLLSAGDQPPYEVMRQVMSPHTIR